MPRLDRNAVIVALAAIVILLFGVVSGIALDRWALRPGLRGGWAAPSGGRTGERLDPARYRVQFSRRLARELELTPEQRARVDSILTRQQEEARSVMREVRPRLEQVATRTRESLRAILTPEQLDRFEELRNRRSERRSRRDRD